MSSERGVASRAEFASESVRLGVSLASHRLGCETPRFPAHHDGILVRDGAAARRAAQRLERHHRALALDERTGEIRRRATHSEKVSPVLPRQRQRDARTGGRHRRGNQFRHRALGGSHRKGHLARIHQRAPLAPRRLERIASRPSTRTRTRVTRRWRKQAHARLPATRNSAPI